MGCITLTLLFLQYNVTRVVYGIVTSILVVSLLLLLFFVFQSDTGQKIIPRNPNSFWLLTVTVKASVTEKIPSAIKNQPSQLCCSVFEGHHSVFKQVEFSFHS